MIDKVRSKINISFKKGGTKGVPTAGCRVRVRGGEVGGALGREERVSKESEASSTRRGVKRKKKKKN